MYIRKSNVCHRCEHIRIAVVVVVQSIVDCFVERVWNYQTVIHIQEIVSYVIVVENMNNICSCCALLIGGLDLWFVPYHKRLVFAG